MLINMPMRPPHRRLAAGQRAMLVVNAPLPANVAGANDGLFGRLGAARRHDLIGMLSGELGHVVELEREAADARGC
jgi:hypothetical protein